MKQEKQSTALKYSKRLAELGVKQKSLWYWWEDTYGMVKKAYLEKKIPYNIKGGWVYCSAFTVAELGEMLRKSKYDIPIKSRIGYKNEWYFQYQDARTGVTSDFEAKTEADARAKMLIYLIENKLL